MNREAKYRAFRSTLGRDLDQFAEILVRNGVSNDPSPLHRASALCQSCHGDFWGYTLAGLILRGGRGVRCVPDIKEFACRLDVFVGGHCNLDEICHDPLSRHEVQIEIKTAGELENSFMQSWHFDRHQDDTDATPPQAAHPRYHFTFGGRALQNHLNTCRRPHFDRVLLMDAPRLPHPPFDGILATDFLLSNFAALHWRKLRNIPEYQRIVAQAQRRLWRPYARALYEHWWGDTHSKSVWPTSQIWPHTY